jgi:hypothetical protein
MYLKARYWTNFGGENVVVVGLLGCNAVWTGSGIVYQRLGGNMSLGNFGIISLQVYTALQSGRLSSKHGLERYKNNTTS